MTYDNIFLYFFTLSKRSNRVVYFFIIVFSGDDCTICNRNGRIIIHDKSSRFFILTNA